MKTIKLPTGEDVLVDDEDLEKLSKHRWRRMKSTSGGLYAMTSIPDSEGVFRTHMIHRIIMGVGKGQQVDHINGNALDNRKENLRILSGSQNLRAFRRKKPSSTSRFMGVSKRSNCNSWEVKVSLRKDGFRIKKYVGSFRTEEEAALAYNKAIMQNGYLPEALNKI